MINEPKNYIPMEVQGHVLAAAIAIHIAQSKAKADNPLGRDAAQNFDGALDFAIKAWDKVRNAEIPAAR